MRGFHSPEFACACALVGAQAGSVSSGRGTLDSHAAWTSNPQNFKKNGFLTAHARATPALTSLALLNNA